MVYLTFNNEKYLANLSIKEFYSTDKENRFKDTTNRLYSFRDIEITPIEALRIFSPAINNKNVAEDTSIGVTITIPQLYKIVKTFDEHFFENPNAIGRVKREAEIEAQEQFSKGTSNMAYNVKSIKITPVKLLGGQAHADLQNPSQDTSSSVIKVSIPQLYEIVKTYDEHFFVNLRAAGRSDREA